MWVVEKSTIPPAEGGAEDDDGLSGLCQVFVGSITFYNSIDLFNNRHLQLFSDPGPIIFCNSKQLPFCWNLNDMTLVLTTLNSNVVKDIVLAVGGGGVEIKIWRN